MSAADRQTSLWYAKKREHFPEIPTNSDFQAHLQFSKCPPTGMSPNI